MRIMTLGVAVLLVSTAAQAQQGAPPRLDCRDMAKTGNFVGSDETYVNGMACKLAVDAPKAQLVSAPVVNSNGQRGEAQVYFFRPARFEGSATHPSVFVDNARVGRLHSGESLSFFVTPGEHRIYSGDKKSSMVLDAKPGETYYIRFDLQGGFLSEHGGLTLVAPQEAALEAGQSVHSNLGGN